MEACYRRQGRTVVVCDRDVEDIVQPEFFEPAYWGDNSATSSTAGRGQVHYLRHGAHRWVLRHYKRGGAIGRVVDDRYWWFGLKASRPWREWHLLAELYDLGFPVPRPIAARIVRSGLWYRGDLISEQLPGVEPLADSLAKERLGIEHWAVLGGLIAKLHRLGIHHTDLNAKNILVGSQKQFFLLDFDGALRTRNPLILETGVKRLRRSLDKFSARLSAFHFSEADWQAFLQAYREAQAA